MGLVPVYYIVKRNNGRSPRGNGKSAAALNTRTYPFDKGHIRCAEEKLKLLFYGDPIIYLQLLLIILY